MEAKTTILLKRLEAYRHGILNDSSHVKESDLSILAGEDLHSTYQRLLSLFDQVAAATKITERRLSLSQHGTSLSSESHVEAKASTKGDKAAESSQETSQPSERLVEAKASTEEDKASESSQETSQPSERLVETKASTEEDKASESSQETRPPSESSVEEKASTEEDKSAESSQETPPPSESPVEEKASIEVDKTAESSQKNRETSASPEERKTFRVLMDVSNFLRNELDVKVLGKYLVVHGKHENVQDEHGTIYREFTRKFEIPEDVDPETFRALFDCYGVLTLKASVKSITSKDGADVIPILEETDSQQVLPFKNLGPEFEELAKVYMKDWGDLKEFARKLARQRPSDYIPMEEVI